MGSHPTFTVCFLLLSGETIVWARAQYTMISANLQDFQITVEKSFPAKFSTVSPLNICTATRIPFLWMSWFPPWLLPTFTDFSSQTRPVDTVDIPTWSPPVGVALFFRSRTTMNISMNPLCSQKAWSVLVLVSSCLKYRNQGIQHSMGFFCDRGDSNGGGHSTSHG